MTIEMIQQQQQWPESSILQLTHTRRRYTIRVRYTRRMTRDLFYNRSMCVCSSSHKRRKKKKIHICTHTQSLYPLDGPWAPSCCSESSLVPPYKEPPFRESSCYPHSREIATSRVTDSLHTLDKYDIQISIECCRYYYYYYLFILNFFNRVVSRVWRLSVILKAHAYFVNGIKMSSSRITPPMRKTKGYVSNQAEK